MILEYYGKEEADPVVICSSPRLQEHTLTHTSPHPPANDHTGGDVRSHDPDTPTQPADSNGQVRKGHNVVASNNPLIMGQKVNIQLGQYVIAASTSQAK